MKKPVFLLMLSLLLVNFQQCNTKINNPSALPPHDSLSSEQCRYIINNTHDTIFLLKNVCVCDSNLPERQIHLSPHPYNLTNSTLKIMVSTVELSTNKVIPVYEIFQRYSGTNLQGSWVKKSVWFDSTLINNTQDSAQFFSVFYSSRTGNYQIIELNENTLTMYRSPDTLNFADNFLKSWPKLVGTDYRIELKRIDNNNIILIGLNRGDTLYISELENRNVSYKCSDTVVKPYTYFANGMQCPNPYYPTWINTFLNANRNCMIYSNFTFNFLKQWKDSLISKWKVSVDSLSPYRLLIAGKKSSDTIIVQQVENCSIYYHWQSRDSTFYNFRDPVLSYPGWLNDFLDLNSKD